ATTRPRPNLTSRQFRPRLRMTPRPRRSLPLWTARPTVTAAVWKNFTTASCRRTATTPRKISFSMPALTADGCKWIWGTRPASNRSTRIPGTPTREVRKFTNSTPATARRKISTPRRTAPDQCGWKLLASVNTKPKSEDGGGQYGVSIADPDDNLGSFRYLLFDIVATEHDDTFGNTFFSEIDVIDTNANVTATTVTNAPAQDFSINSREAPGLKDWAEQKLAPVLADWYPKITTMLASDGYTAPTHFSVTLKPMD